MLPKYFPVRPPPHPAPPLQVYFLWMDTQAPARLQSDNGTEFCNWILDLLCAQFGVDHICGAVGHPQSQGAVERCNGTIKNKIRALLMTLPTFRCSAALAAAGRAALLRTLSPIDTPVLFPPPSHHQLGAPGATGAEDGQQLSRCGARRPHDALASDVRRGGPVRGAAGRHRHL